MAETQIKEWQRRIGVTIDGQFGPVTLERSIDLLEELERLRQGGKIEAPQAGIVNPYSIKDHWLYLNGKEVSRKLSPNYGDVIDPTLIVVHYTGDNSLSGALSWLSSPQSGVSCHLVIAKTGSVWQLLPFNIRAWHAGVSSWRGRAVGNSVNAFSVGIENVGIGDEWPVAQIDANRLIIAALQKKYGIEDVAGHSEVAPGRKVDPGTLYPWKRVLS